MRTMAGRALTVSCIALLLASCGALQHAVVQRTPLRIAYSSRWGDGTMVIADKKGFFSKHGVEIEPVYYPISNDELADLAAADIDGGLMAIGDAVNVANRSQIKVVAVADDGGGSTIIASPQIATLSDLKGKRIGVQLGTWHELIVSEMLASAGLSASDVILSNLHPEEVPTALGSQVDAAYTWEPFTSIALTKDNRVLFESKELIGAFPNVIVFRQPVAQERSEEIRAFLQAWFEAADFRQKNPDEAARIISTHFGTSGENPGANISIRILNRADNYIYFQDSGSGNQPSLSAVTQTNAEYLLRIGVLTQLPDVKKLLDPSYLQ